MAARKKFINQTQKTKDTIRAGMLMKRLEDHATGLVEMTSTQVRAAEIVLKKLRPDLQSVAMTAEVTTTDARELTDAELAAIAAGGSPGAAKAAKGKGEPSSVH